MAAGQGVIAIDMSPIWELSVEGRDLLYLAAIALSKLRCRSVSHINAVDGRVRNAKVTGKE